MKWVALIVWVITALGGFGLLGICLRRGGMKQPAQPGRRIRPPLILTHMVLAAAGLVLWVVYVASGARGFAGVAFVLTLAVASLGFGMLALWLQRRQGASAVGAPGGPAAEGALPAEQHFPIAIVAAPGLVAAATLVLVLLAALKVGGS